MVTDPAGRKRSTRLKPLSFDAPADPAALPPSRDGHDLDVELYLNRALTWLAFNRRMLHEAQDERTPLLEQANYLAIVHSNLDEFLKGAPIARIRQAPASPLDEARNGTVIQLSSLRHQVDKYLVR